MSLSDFDQQYAGYGIPSVNPQTMSALDSGVVAVSTTPHSTTLTVAANADGTQPTVVRGKLVVSMFNLNASAVVGQVDVWVGDNTSPSAVLEYVASIPASSSATAGQGATFVMDIFIPRLTGNAGTIKTIVIRTTTTGNNNYSKQCRFLGERD